MKLVTHYCLTFLLQAFTAEFNFKFWVMKDGWEQPDVGADSCLSIRQVKRNRQRKLLMFSSGLITAQHSADHSSVIKTLSDAFLLQYVTNKPQSPLPQPVEGTTMYRNYIMAVWERAGACTVTATQHRHDLSAAFTQNNLQLFGLAVRPHTGRCFRTLTWTEPPLELHGELREETRQWGLPSHTGDAKHPAGLQRDPAKERQAGRVDGACAAGLPVSSSK